VERKLLLLGLLRGQEMHGYQLNEFIDCHLGPTVHLKKPTAYRLLNQMVEDGWITFVEEREGSRPPRRVFTITPDGETAFQGLLRESMAQYQPLGFLGNVGLLFLHTVPHGEAVELLQQRRTRVESLLEAARSHTAHRKDSSLILVHQIRHLSTEMEWLDEIIAELEEQHNTGH